MFTKNVKNLIFILKIINDKKNLKILTNTLMYVQNKNKWNRQEFAFNCLLRQCKTSKINKTKCECKLYKPYIL